MAKPEPAVLTIKEAADIAKISRMFLYRLIQGKVPGQKGPPVKRIGSAIRIPVKSFLVWLETPTKRAKRKG